MNNDPAVNKFFVEAFRNAETGELDRKAIAQAYKFRSSAQFEKSVEDNGAAVLSQLADCLIGICGGKTGDPGSCDAEMVQEIQEFFKDTPNEDGETIFELVMKGQALLLIEAFDKSAPRKQCTRFKDPKEVARSLLGLSKEEFAVAAEISGLAVLEAVTSEGIQEDFEPEDIRLFLCEKQASKASFPKQILKFTYAYLYEPQVDLLRKLIGMG
jgi:hypothetical protein